MTDPDRIPYHDVDPDERPSKRDLAAVMFAVLRQSLAEAVPRMEIERAQRLLNQRPEPE